MEASVLINVKKKIVSLTDAQTTVPSAFITTNKPYKEFSKPVFKQYMNT